MTSPNFQKPIRKGTVTVINCGILRKHHETVDEVEVDWKILKFLERAASAETWNIKSPAFDGFSSKWQLEIIHTSGHELQMFLHKASTVDKLPVALKFGIRLKDGTFEMRSYHTKAFRNGSNSWGTYEVILESELSERKDELLPEGNLTLSCSIALLDIVIQSKKRKIEHPGVLSSDLMGLLESQNNFDTVIIVGDQSYHAHKAILAARSDVFSAMFQHDMEETQSNIINVTDCDPNAFKDFLSFLYTDKIENFTFDNIYQLYKIGDKYNVQGVKNLCIDYIVQNLSVTNLFDITNLANHHQDIKLLSAAQDFFLHNALEVTESEAWENFMKENFPLANRFLTSTFKILKTRK